jgi:hypothetical protein
MPMLTIVARRDLQGQNVIERIFLGEFGNPRKLRL